MFIYFEKEREAMCNWGKGKERGKERILSRLCAVSTEPDVGLNPTNRERVT